MSGERRTERGIPLNERIAGEIFDPDTPLVPKLAEAAAPKEKVPTAGGYAIDRFILPQSIRDEVAAHPECMIGEDDVFRMNLDPELPYSVRGPEERESILKNIPKELLECKGEKPYVFSPMKDDSENGNNNVTDDMNNLQIADGPNEKSHGLFGFNLRKFRSRSRSKSKSKSKESKNKDKSVESKDKGGESKVTTAEKPKPPPPNPKPKKFLGAFTTKRDDKAEQIEKQDTENENASPDANNEA